jgi:hypothetical protein
MLAFGPVVDIKLKSRLRAAFFCSGDALSIAAAKCHRCGDRAIKHQASSIEHQASSIKHRASSIEHRASSIEHRASSIKP